MKNISKYLSILLMMVLVVWVITTRAATTTYYAQSSTGAANGTDCADALALPGSLAVSAGNTYVYCGTGTYAAGTSAAVTLTGGGSSGNPAIFRFAHGAIMQAPYWGQNAAIRVAASNITVDGSSTGTPCGYILGVDTTCDGTIQATANGALLANHVAGGKGVWVNANLTNVTVQNLNIQNLFVPVTTGNANNETTGSFSGNSMCVYADFTNQHLLIQNNVCTNSHSMVRWGYEGTSGNSNVIQNNVFNGTAEGVWIGAGSSGSTIDSGGTISSINNNDFSNLVFDTVAYPPCSGSGANHQEFIHLYTQQTSSQIGTAGAPFQISNNYFHGQTGCSFTSEIYIECDSSAMCGAPNHLFVDIFGNRIISEDPNSALALNAGGNGMSECEGSTCRYANNTYYSDVGHSSSSNFAQHCEAGSIMTLINNIFDGMNQAFVNACGGSPTFATNLGFGLATACGSTCSLSGNPLLNTGSSPPYQLTSTSSGAYQTGTNETALGIVGLSTDPIGTARPSSGAWDVGAFEFISGSVVLSPASENFGSVILGFSSSPVTFTLTNNSSVTATSIIPITTGGNPGDFTITNSGAGSCNAAGNSIVAGASCTFTVTFSPASTGFRSTTLSVAYSGGDSASPKTSALSGTGATGTVTLAPTSQNFGSVSLGSSSASVTFTLTNTNATSVTSIVVTNTGGNTGDFINLGTGTCTSTLAASSSCTIVMNFTPLSTGSRSTTLNVADSASSSPQQSSLSGLGISVGAVGTSISGGAVLNGNIVTVQ